MAEGRPPVEVDLVWEGGLRFQARSGSTSLLLDSDGLAGPSPVQALVMALAGCMSVDVVHILERGRTPPRALRARARAERAPEEPRRVVSVDLRFEVEGDVSPDRVERAIALSRETYCSVWHSLRPDIAFTTSFEVVEP